MRIEVDDKTGVWMDEDSGKSAARIIAEASMRGLNLDESDFRWRDRVISSISSVVEKVINSAVAGSQ